ncbi:MAG TPA: bifunctional folylpolyglutamate synthase/dihydrofolate synthase, partial [Flavobacteriales bacterium]|nr:bifunctional folylpolyglutamate synthase/dihydrofolate synthase [Flavobacteriales bacterium]
ATYYFCKADVPRGLAADLLWEQAKMHGLLGTPFTSVTAAFDAARKNAHLNDLVLVTGSVFVVAEVI